MVETNNDELLIVKLEENFEYEETDNNISSKLELESKILQRDKENAELKAALKDMKYEKEILVGKYEIEKLRSENVLMKAEKQFGIDVKTAANRKRKIEEELVNTKAKITKLDEQQSKFEEEKIFLKENFEELEKKITKLEGHNIKLRKQNTQLKHTNNVLKDTNKKHQEKNITLYKEKNKFENLYMECKHEKENLLLRQKSLEGSSISKLTSQKHGHKEIPKEVSKVREVMISLSNQLDYARMPLGDLLKIGVAMIFEQAPNPNYVNWYKSMHQRSRTILSNIIWQDYFLYKHCGGPSKEPLYIDLGMWLLPNGWNLLSSNIKILHTRDNRKQKDIEYISDDEWLISDLSKEFVHEGYFLILVKKQYLALE
eukprot:TCONS_00022991-protein